MRHIGRIGSECRLDCKSLIKWSAWLLSNRVTPIDTPAHSKDTSRDDELGRGRRVCQILQLGTRSENVIKCWCLIQKHTISCHLGIVGTQSLEG